MSRFDAVKGVRLMTTEPYARTLTWNSLVSLLDGCLKNGEPDGQDRVTFRYIRHTRRANPYRTIRIDVLPTPNNDAVVTDFPSGGHSGLEPFYFANPRYVPQQPTLHHDHKNGMMYESVPPMGWENK